jgi:hypothetical protein
MYQAESLGRRLGVFIIATSSNGGSQQVKTLLAGQADL